MPKTTKEISGRTIARLAVYYCTLEKMRDEGETICSSLQLEQQTGIASSLIRRDLSHFGGFGTKGVGYEIDVLLAWIIEILGYNTEWSSVLVGQGVPLTGISNYDGMLPPGFNITAVVDLKKKNHGRKIPGLNLTINPLGKLANLIKSHNIPIGIVSVSPDNAQKVVDIMVKAGIKGIANFSSVPVHVPDNIPVSQVNVTSCLSQLSYNLTSMSTKAAPSLA